MRCNMPNELQPFWLQAKCIPYCQPSPAVSLILDSHPFELHCNFEAEFELVIQINIL